MVDIRTILDQVQVVWILIVGFLLTFFLAFSIGANSVANIFGTSIGARVLSQFQAVILTAIFMTLGAVIMGPAVTNTIANNLVDIRLYKLDPELLMLGQISIMLACALWTIIATALKLPIAATHSVVGAVVGCHVMEIGIEGIHWQSLLYIGISWVTSPLLSGVLALAVYFIVWKTIVEKENPLESGARTLPVWFGCVIFINVLSVHLQVQSLLKGFMIPWYLSVANSFVCGVLAALLVWYFLVPRLTKTKENEKEALLKDRRNIPLDNHLKAHDQDCQQDSESYNETSDEEVTNAKLVEKSDRVALTETEKLEDNPDIARMCSPLLVVSVIFSAFAYGSILVSISVAPLITLWDVYDTRGVTSAIGNPVWMFLFGSVALVLGFATFGGGVTETIGEGITSLSPASAFPVEIGTTSVLLIASNLGIPISSSQSKIGAIAAVGCFSDGGVDFKVLWKIILVWLVTLPVTTGLSALLMAFFQLTYEYTETGVLTSNSTFLLEGIL